LAQEGIVRWTKEGERWLEDIYAYIALNDEEAAWNTVIGIKAKADKLIDNPNIGYRHEDDELPDNVRITLYGRYRIAYEIGDPDVFVLGVFHGALEMKRFLSRYR
jgi:plasmid stabilization system protein ParE